jgi:hypothetical protein
MDILSKLHILNMKNRKNDIWELMVRYRFWVLQRVLQHTFLHNYVVCNVGFTARA